MLILCSQLSHFIYVLVVGCQSKGSHQEGANYKNHKGYCDVLVVKHWIRHGDSCIGFQSFHGHKGQNDQGGLAGRISL